MKNFDLVIFGGGPGGYVSAIRAKQLGINVLLVESKDLGGVCLNWGCIPTKALLKVSEFKNSIKKFEEFGISVKGEIAFDIKDIVQRSRNVSKQLSIGVKHLLKKNNVEVIKGFGSIVENDENIIINVLNDQSENVKIQTKNLIIATGAQPKLIPGVDVNNQNIWTAKEAMVPKSLPKSITIIGSGAIGMEFASFYNDMGSKVTVIEMKDRILPNEDEEISEMAKSLFIKKGIKFLNNSSLVSVDHLKNNIISKVKVNEKIIDIESDKLLIAIGIIGNTENMGLEKAEIKMLNGHIVTNEKMCTNIPNIYAIGDVTDPPWLAHKASHEGIIAAEIIAGIKEVHKLDKTSIPACTYSYPQIASIGLNEKQASEKGLKVKVGSFPFLGNGKSITLGQKDGFIKTLFDEETGELIGAHMIGAEVTELINSFSIAKTLETTEVDIINTVFAHPTLSEAMHESVLSAYNKAIHF
ncbi:MAG: dihydrolipoyl dehydrogenase [Candidatus Puniceispirillales bacterium]